MYLDPGFGSMLVQIILAGLAVCGVFLFRIRAKIVALFKRKPEETDEDDELVD
ncbi:MAG: hypothetical protein FWD25_13490 [Clostridia bacterium]|nr:hypothetical protein [Clostridia bacterium]